VDVVGGKTFYGLKIMGWTENVACAGGGECAQTLNVKKPEGETRVGGLGNGWYNIKMDIEDST
jgi:hypothetical protein